MVSGVSAEAERESVVQIDGVTGKVLGTPTIRDIPHPIDREMCGARPGPRDK
jgi:hypothetical protein